MEEIKYFEIRGYDDNFDLCGPHEEPLLAIVRGTKSQAYAYAKTLPSFSCEMGKRTLTGSIYEIEILDLTNKKEKDNERV